MNVCSRIYITLSGILRLTEFLCLWIQKARKQTIEYSVLLTRNISFRIKYKIWMRLDLVTFDGQERYNWVGRRLRQRAELRTRFGRVLRQRQLVRQQVERQLGGSFQGLLDKDFNQPPSMRPISDNLESSCW